MSAFLFFCCLKTFFYFTAVRISFMYVLKRDDGDVVPYNIPTAVR